MKPPLLLVGLAAAAFALPLSIAGSNAALALLTVAVLVRLRGDGRTMWAAWRGEPALKALAAYVAAGLIAAALGGGLSHSLRDCAKDAHRLWSLGLFVAALALEPDLPLWPAFAAGFSVAAVVGIEQSLSGMASSGVVARAAAFVHPVTFGDIMALGTLGGLCWLARPPLPGTGARRWAVAALVLCAAALALSQTRAALIALAAGALALAVLEPRVRALAGAALGLGAAGAAAGEFLRHGRTALAASGPEPTRYGLWRTALRMFHDHPWTGVGPGHYSTFFDRYSGPLEGDAHWGSAHNLYLHQLAERGVLGFAILVVLLTVLLIRAWRAARTRNDAAALWAGAAVPAFLVMNLTETAFQSEQFATLFLLIWAFGTKRSRQENL